MKAYGYPYGLKQVSARVARRGLAVSVATILSATVAIPLLAQDYRGDVSFSVPKHLQLPSHNTAVTWVGSVTSQADGVTNANAARTMFGVDGSGIKIGVISDSYDFLAGAAASIAAGDLPGVGNPNGFVTPVNVVNDHLVASSTDEGRAMIELIHDLAPGAEILFHSAFNNPGAAGSPPSTTIANAIDALRIAGANIIVDDVGILTTANYQDGASAQAANAAFAAGIPYFSSAGNNDNNAYEDTYSPFMAGSNHDFDANASEGGDNILDIGVIPNNGSVRATLWWDDPYASIGGAATSNFALGLVDLNTNVVVDGSDQNQLAGADAFEFFSFTNTTGGPVPYGIFVDHIAGVANKLLNIQVNGQPIGDDDDTNSPTIFGHNSAEGAVAVAAQFYADPGLDDVEPFSAHGPSTILYDTAGNAAPEVRGTPQITGIDGTDTSFFGVDVEPNGFPNFFGTSAAAPHVAAIAALALEHANNLGKTFTPAELYNLLFKATVDIEGAGFDNLSGFGRLDAKLALSLVPEPTTTLLALFAALASLAPRRRRHGG